MIIGNWMGETDGSKRFFLFPFDKWGFYIRSYEYITFFNENGWNFRYL